MVTDSPSDSGDGGGASRQSPFRYTDIFKKQFPYYLSIGMSYDEYWNGDCDLTKYYREADELREDRKNTEMWLQGMYFYEALLDAAPAIKAFCKEPAREYRDKPYPISRRDVRKAQKEEHEKKLQQSSAAMMAIMIALNQRRKGNVEGEHNSA